MKRHKCASAVFAPLVLLSACASSTAEQGVGPSGAIPHRWDNAIKTTRAGDPNAYELRGVNLGEGASRIWVMATSGPNATISNGSLKSRKDRAEAMAAFGAHIWYCKPAKAVRDAFVVPSFDESKNAWTFIMKCAV